MNAVEALGWVGAAIAIVSWMHASWTHNYRAYDRWNILSSMILVPVDLAVGAPFAAVISAFYGLASVVSIVKHRVGGA